MSEGNFGQWDISFSLTGTRRKHVKNPPKIMVGENSRRAVDDGVAE